MKPLPPKDIQAAYVKEGDEYVLQVQWTPGAVADNVQTSIVIGDGVIGQEIKTGEGELTVTGVDPSQSMTLAMSTVVFGAQGAVLTSDVVRHTVHPIGAGRSDDDARLDRLESLVERIEAVMARAERIAASRMAEVA